MKRQTTTEDIGFAIRDFCEGNAISHIDLTVNDVAEHPMADKIEGIDISDVNNPIFHMESGAQFTIRIVRTG